MRSSGVPPLWRLKGSVYRSEYPNPAPRSKCTDVHILTQLYPELQLKAYILTPLYPERQ